MVKKKDTIDETSSQESNNEFKQEDPKEIPITNMEIKKGLSILHSKIDYDTIKKLDADKDVAIKNKKSMLNKIYPYWVYIFKDGKKIKDFGVRQEDINGVKLLIRTEKVNNELKVIFRELYPEPKFDLSLIDANKKRISQELNKYKQLEQELEKKLFNEDNNEEYNYDLADVRIAILEKEVMLDSIKYGKTIRYFQDIREDGIPCLFYEFENNGLRLKKEVKEKALFTEASEVKQIESLETKRDIDNQLKKKDNKDWLKIAAYFMLILLLLVFIYGVFKLLNYNHEREYGEIKAELEQTMVTYNRGVTQIIQNCNSAYKDNKLIEALTTYTASNRELINITLSKYQTTQDGRNIIS